MRISLGSRVVAREERQRQTEYMARVVLDLAAGQVRDSILEGDVLPDGSPRRWTTLTATPSPLPVPRTWSPSGPGRAAGLVQGRHRPQFGAA
jgi:hypothetical protein